MNRWLEWAERLRARHSRREGRRQAGALVFARGARFLSRHTRIVSRIVLQVRPRLSVTLRVVPPVSLAHRPMLVPSPAASALRSRQEGRAPSPSWPRPRESSTGAPPAAGSALTFAEERFTHSRLVLEGQQVQRFHDVVDRWRRKPIVAIEASELPRRIRGRGARAETSEQAAAVPVLFRRPEVSSPPAAWMPATPGEASRTYAGPSGFAPVLPAIDVDALTSQVIHQLDRRLVAYRERMGRS